MTSNQIAARAAKETERSNKIKEKETYRSNKAKEDFNERKRKSDLGIASMNTASSIIGNAAKIAGLGPKPQGNSPSWYNLDKQMVHDAANLSFDTPLGYDRNPSQETVSISSADPTSNNIQRADTTAPGVMGLHYIPMIGNENIVQTAALNIYAYVRHANSGSRNYEYQDLIKYLFAVDSAYIGICELKRIYSILNTYKGYSRYYSEGYIRAILRPDIPADDINFNINLAALRYNINLLVNRVNALYVPNVMSMFERHAWMSSSIFKDYPIKRSNNYMFVASHIYKYDENVDSPSFGQLVPFQYRSADLTQMIYNVQSVIDALLQSEDIGIMSGDILKAYGNNNLYHLPSISDDYHIEELYSAEVLSQISSATVLDKVVPESTLIYEDPVTHKLKQGFNTDLLPIPDRGDYSYLKITGNGLPFSIARNRVVTSDLEFKTVSHNKGIVNMYKDDISEDDVMVATRLMVSTDLRLYPTKIANEYCAVERILTNGTEVLTRATLIKFTFDSQDIDSPSGLSDIYVADGRLVNLNDLFMLVSALSTFDWAPMIRLAILPNNLASENNLLVYNNKDLCNFAVVSQDVMNRLHNVAVNSELGVPLLGMKVRS